MDDKTFGRTKAKLVVLSIFVLGFAAGALGMNLYGKMTTRAPGRGSQPRMSMLEKMNERLNLTAEQQHQVEAILEDTFERYGEIKKDIAPRFNAVRQQSRDRLKTVLTAEQLPKFEEMVQESDQRKEKYERDGRRDKK
jgi:hypothetical protein